MKRGPNSSGGVAWMTRIIDLRGTLCLKVAERPDAGTPEMAMDVSKPVRDRPAALKGKR